MKELKDLNLSELDKLYDKCDYILERINVHAGNDSLFEIIGRIDEEREKYYTKPIGEWHQVSIWYDNSWQGSCTKTQYEGTDKLKAEKAWNKKISERTTRKQYKIWEYNPSSVYTMRLATEFPKILHNEIVECKHGSIV
jgi:hypothetical protein